MAATIDATYRELRALMRNAAALDVPPHAPQVPHVPHAARQLRPAAVLILFGALDDASPVGSGSGATVPAELDVLLTRRSNGMRHHANQIAFPGGGIDADDADASSAALREAEEETGLRSSGVEVLGTFAPIPVPVSKNLVTPVVGWWRSPSEVAADHSESVEVFRVPVAELLGPASRGTSVLRRAGATYRGDAFRLAPRFGGRVVWGFTGVVLSRLFDAAGWSTPWDRTQQFSVEG